MFQEPYFKGSQSDHFDGKKFFYPGKSFNPNFLKVLKWRLFGRRPKWPEGIAVKSVMLQQNIHPNSIRTTYIGHASFLIQVQGFNILLDPHFSLRASPLSWLGFKRVQKPGITLTQLPRIDVIFISHNHYDHLDLPSLTKIWKRDNPRIITPLGNDKVIHPRIKKAQIDTLDWGNSLSLSDQCSLTLLPAQHWSARSLFDRNYALWGSACLTMQDKTIFFMGDSGFDPQLLKEIRQKIGVKIDLAILPIGSYAPQWLMSYSHMNPEEAWEAFRILEADWMIPMHYDTFQLGDESYGEALPRLLQKADVQNHKVIALSPGKHFDL